VVAGAAEGVPGGGRRLGRLPRRVPPVPQPSLLADDRFRAFLVARVLAGAAQSALVYAFLLLVVDETASATFNSLFVICSILPAILFGLPAGVAVPIEGMTISSSSSKRLAKLT